MMGALPGLVLPVAAAWLAILAWRGRPWAGSSVLTAAVAFCIGVGLSSVTTFWFVALGGELGPWFVAADALLWSAVAGAAWYRFRRVRAAAVSDGPVSPASGAGRLTAADWLVRAAFAVTASLAVATVIAEYAASPHGQWDAWAIWNQKARFLMRGGDQWTALFAIPWSNPSHPLLLPASVARLWTYAGAELTAVPAVLSFAFGAAIVAAVTGGLGLQRKRAWIAGAVLVAAGTFTQLAGAQTADLPLGLFVVVALLVLRNDRAAWLDDRDARASLFLAGLLGSLATWTKNEGLVFVAITALLSAWIVARHARGRHLAWWAAGAAPILLTFVWFKVSIAPVTPPYFSETETAADMLQRLVGPERHAIVDAMIGQYWIRWGGPRAAGALPLVMAAAAFVALSPSGRAVRGIAVAVVLMLLSYYAVWLLSPLDTAWLVSTTFDRLVAQVWPSLVVLAFSAGRLRRSSGSDG